MKFLRPFLIAACAQVVIASPLALAQSTQSGQQGAQPGQQEPGATTRYADPSHKASSAEGGTLMQKREQGMSPQSPASGTATGKIPQ